MSMDYSQLREPVTRDDITEQEEYLEVTVETQRNLAARVRFQYQMDSWISEELDAVADLLEQATAKLPALRATNCFPIEP